MKFYGAWSKIGLFDVGGGVDDAMQKSILTELESAAETQI